MPRAAADDDLAEALRKKGGLNLSQLANYDDIITDALVDRVYFWSTIRKLKATYHPCRGVQQETVCKILQDHVIIAKDVSTAFKKLLVLPGIQKFYRALGTPDEQEHFHRHLRRYIHVYLPDCPFEIGTTNRYTIMTAEAAVIARRDIRKGEQIKYLIGIQVEMTEKEEKELTGRTDFSIVLSSRRKRPSIFLGPARFANHDCDSNARLNTSGPHGIHIAACKDIAAGDEITVTYGDDYFGIDNCECLCATCESLLRNGWDPRGPLLKEDSSDEEVEDVDEAADARAQARTKAARTRMAKVAKRHAERSPLKKRKRVDEPLLQVDEDGRIVPKKRGPGRPRKHARPDDREQETLKAALLAQQVRRQRRAQRDESDASDDDEINERRDGRGRYLSRQGRGQHINAEPQNDRPVSRSWFLRSREASREPSKDPLLERVFNMLLSIGDRKLSGRDRPKSTSAGSPEKDCEVMSEEAELEKPNECTGRFTRRGALSSGKPTPSYARGLSRSPSFELSHEFSIDRHSDKQEIVIKQEHGPSSRGSIIASGGASRSLYDVSESSPPPGSTSRRQGLLSANLLVDDNPSTGSASPSSAGGSSGASSEDTVASSATSMDGFAAGNIALSICNMLTTEIEVEPVEDLTAAESASGLLSPPRGRQTRRKSAPQSSHQSLVPAMHSIEQNGVAEDVSAATGGASQGGDAEEGDEDEEPSEKRGSARMPGDYTLCRVLLATAYHRWVSCRNCDDFFVQPEAYLTRIACPRCERHSKLYGYYWPKTDREGKTDREERVLDHRTIHRFIDPEDERRERKGRKTLADVVREREESARESSVEESGGVERRLRGSSRGRSESRRKLRTTM